MAHLTDQQLQHLKRQLTDRRRDLLGEIRTALEQSEDGRHQELAGMVGDPGDESIANMITDLDLKIADRHVNEVRAVQEALDRIAEGRYGECIDCGGEIPYERLAAMPTAQRCVRCQTRHEKVYAGDATPRL